jgi:molybdopterin molybdotransferase
MPLLSVEDALSRILDGVAPTASETVPLAACAGRILSAGVAAKLTQPPFHASAMDGYAVQASDVATLPAKLGVIGEAAAGHGFRGTIKPGECVRIFTGAPVPAGADAIVIQENTSRDGSVVTVTDGIPDPAHIRRCGADFAEGDVLLGAGRRLDARALTLAAAMGHGALPVRKKPCVAILATGDELVAPGIRPGPDQIVCSNPFGLAAMILAAGAEPQHLGIAGDTRDAITEKLAMAVDADVIVTIGGASVGDHDLVAPALKERGMALDFWKIAMRPGKPMLFGRIGIQRVLGLPGNPVSSLVTGRVFLVPLLHRLLGVSVSEQVRETAILAHPLEANGPRAHYMRARFEAGRQTSQRVVMLPDQDSSLIAPLANADCLVVRAPGASALPAGAEVEILRLDF